MMNIKNRITRSIIQLQKSKPFWAYLSLFLKFKEVKKEEMFMPTMGVNCETGEVYYVKEFVDKLTDDEIIGTLCHELNHIAFLTDLREGNRDKIGWNFACFKPNELVGGNYKKISELEKDDKVIDLNGKKTKVIIPMKRKYDGNMIKIKATNILPFEATPEHPILVSTRKKKGYPIKLEKPIWKEAKDLTTNDYLIISKIKPNININLINLDKYVSKVKVNNHLQAHNIKRKLRKGVFPINKETAWLLGLYVAEGSSQNKGKSFQFSLNSKEKHLVKKIKEINKKYFKYSIKVYKYPEKDCIKVSVPSSILERAFKEWCGRGAKNKKIPDFILCHKNKEILKSFLEGYIDGDGCRYKKRRLIVMGTISKILALQLQTAYVRLGKLASVTYSEKKERYIGKQKLPIEKIYYITICEHKGTTRILQNQIIKSNNMQWKNYKNYILTPIKKLEKTKYKGYVYNISTESHSYTINNSVVHNCDLEINSLLKNNNFKLPQGVLMPDCNDEFDIGTKKIKGISKLTAEEIYDKLPKIKMKGVVYVVGGGKGKGKELGKAFDEHIKSKGKDGKGLSPKEKKELEEVWKDRLSEAINVARMKGDVPAGLERLVDNLHKEKINWKALLSRYITNQIPYNFTWAKAHKKSISVNTYLPDIVKEKISIVICIDVSGSIGQKELNDFLSEVCGIARAYQERIDMKLITHEIDLNDEYDIVNGSISEIKNIKIHGGGGTSHESTFNHIRDNVRDCKAVLFFTDGYSDLQSIDFQKYPFEKLFVISKDGDEECLKNKNCQVIKLKEDFSK